MKNRRLFRGRFFQGSRRKRIYTRPSCAWTTKLLENGNKTMIRCVFRSRILLSLTVLALAFRTAQAQSPSVVHPNLSVRTVVSCLNQPTTMAFIGTGDMFVL